MSETDIEETQPHIELFVHCAGFGIMGKIQDISMEEQAEMVDVNCRSVVEISSLLLPYMKYRGRMIYMASAAAFLHSQDLLFMRQVRHLY